MTDTARSREELQAELEAAVKEAFDQYGTVALWSKRQPEAVVPGTGRSIAYSLRLEAPASARRLVERLEDLADALEPAVDCEASFAQDTHQVSGPKRARM
jgi:hypothetical protein